MGRNPLNTVHKQEFVSNFEHKVVFGQSNTELLLENAKDLKQTIKELAQYTPNDADLGGKIRMLINKMYER